MAQEQQQEQSKDISQETIVKYLESPDFLRLPPKQKQQAVDYLKTRMQRPAGSGMPNVGESVERRRKAGTQALTTTGAVLGGEADVESEDKPGVGSQLTTGAVRGLYGLVSAPGSIMKTIRSPKKAIEPHIETAKKSVESFKKGRISEGFGYGGATLLPFLGPWAAHLGETVGKGKPFEALGEAAVYWLGDRLARRSQKEIPKAQRLSAATGSLPEHFEVLATDMAETAKKLGKPKTVGELSENLAETNKRLTSEFNTLLQPLRAKRILPQQIATKLLQKAQEYDIHTPEGRATRAYLRRRAVDYMKQWSVGELDAKRRQLFNARLEAKSPSGQAVSMKASDEVLADKIIEDGLKDTVYDEVQAANPKVDIRKIKEKESRLIEIRDELKKEMDKLAVQQAEFKTMPLSKRIGMSLSAHTTGVTPRMHGLLPKSGPMELANKQVKKAFPNKLQQLGTKLRIQTIKNYPIAALYSQSQKEEVDPEDFK